MRSLVLALPLLAACGPNPLIGTFNFTVTGTDTTTSPMMSPATVSGMGTIAITQGAMSQIWDITVAQAGSTACTIHGTLNSKDPLTIDITAGETCALQFPTGNVTATMTTGSSATVKQDTLTMTVGYNYSGTFAVINTPFSGMGTRTYTGPRI